ncbi:NADH dehydrogenase [ubiquinone] 1 alpha subcomplex subunit 2 [Zea mays]|uniref:NADH dehydrogenase [ubiquinone] 1 alpha subcomplex subunit 2 n=1 Tax=Zea mays TaxID=4577 RepID=A0A1D6J4I7_MAIZE|nr:NADH dehydrogenase [ubiquinone] 1 alpha subcomplex subunit 2 [Zea mays]
MFSVVKLFVIQLRGPLREFVKKNYGDIKARNPSLPFLVRECSGVQPQLWARYASGVMATLLVFLSVGLVGATDGIGFHLTGKSMSDHSKFPMALFIWVMMTFQIWECQGFANFERFTTNKAGYAFIKYQKNQALAAIEALNRKYKIEIMFVPAYLI